MKRPKGWLQVTLACRLNSKSTKYDDYNIKDRKIL